MHTAPLDFKIYKPNVSVRTTSPLLKTIFEYQRSARVSPLTCDCERVRDFIIIIITDTHAGCSGINIVRVKFYSQRALLAAGNSGSWSCYCCKSQSFDVPAGIPLLSSLIKCSLRVGSG